MKRYRIFLSLLIVMVLFGSTVMAGTAALKISCPEGSYIFLDSQFYGVKTVGMGHVIISNIPAGNHTLTLHKKECMSSINRFNMLPDDTFAITISYRGGEPNLTDVQFDEYAKKNTLSKENSVVPYRMSPDQLAELEKAKKRSEKPAYLRELEEHARKIAREGQYPLPDDLVPVDREPKMIQSTAPVYPQSLLGSGTTGTVWIKALADTTGSVVTCYVMKSSKSEALDQAAVEAGMQNKYTPAKRMALLKPCWYIYKVDVKPNQ